ncbi:hypothetical protein MKO06_01970 [Gramella sp. GC03-9]|uniref:Uncharacterized protein n=1 Tax=Christiangramia oceanisediminis TaxID=2920386 RepID=A0A9X2I0F2_9FLAO|nr:hypothetical protein [Gramella oceanisediminis]MCP9198656.1 hypothetical protein [Gramella oceanisediminis]
MKKFLVLGILFALPITAYLFFASGKNNFARLPVLTEKVKDIDQFKTNTDSVISFRDKISVVAFFGSELDDIKGNTFNLDQKILEKYYDFNDFQFVLVLPEEAETRTQQFVTEFNKISESSKWKIAYASPQKVQEVFDSFQSPHKLDENSFTPYVFIIDKDLQLRGRDDDEDDGKLYGYDSSNVAELSNKMNDDVKVILAEYRLALKRNNREK